MDTSQNNIGYFPQMLICDKHSSVELNSDFTLPDYQPEIRRLLGVRTIIPPQNEYIGNGNAEFSGEICYKITYLGADGGLYCANLSDKYSFNASLDFNSHSTGNDEVTLLPSCKIENSSTRVLGPRKLNVRSKLICRLWAFSPSIYLPNLVGAHTKSHIENKISEASCINVKRSTSESLILNDFISFDTQNDDVRIIDCVSTPVINECLPSNDKISVKGEVVYKLLYCNDHESTAPLSSVKKIPFSCELPSHGVNSLFECNAHGVCFDERFDFKENGIAVEITLSLSATAQKNEMAKYIADSYSTEKTCENSFSSLSLTRAVKSCQGNLTQNDVFALDSIKLSPDAKIIDVIAKSNISELSLENEKLVLKGNNDFQMICLVDEEYSSISLTSPIRYEVDCRSNADCKDALKWCVHVEPSSVRARHDGERLFVDSELNLGIMVNCETNIDILSEMIFGEHLKKSNSEILLCYPEKNATVWSVAKEYGEPQKNIRVKNSIPENEENIKKRFLVI